MPLLLVTPPTVEPLSVADVRDRLGYGTDVSDTLITALIKSARQKLEKQYGVAMINQTWSLVLDRFPGCWANPRPQETGFYPVGYYDSRSYPNYGNRLNSFEIPINLTPLLANAIQSVTYLDADGTSQTFGSSNYALVRGDLRSNLVLTNQSSWPTTAYVAGAIDIRFIAGFGATAADVPETLKSAMTLLIAHLRALTAQNLFISLESEEGVGETRYIVGTGSTDVIDAAVSSLMQDYVRVSL
jgi:hypothetical protein